LALFAKGPPGDSQHPKRKVLREITFTFDKAVWPTVLLGSGAQ